MVRTSIDGYVRAMEGFSVVEEGPWPWLQLAGDPRFRVIRATLPVHGWPPELNGWTFVHLSDVHIRKVWEPVLDGVVDVIRTSAAQAVFCSGDWVEDKIDHTPALPHVRRLLDLIQTPCGTHSVIGNHDGPKLARHLRDAPAQFIDHRLTLIQARSHEIELIGVGGYRRKHARVHRFPLYPTRRPGVPRIVLGHYPSLIRMVSLHLQPDLYLTGHTHGGQVCLPGWGPLISHDTLPKKYATGIHRWSDTWLSVSRGIGFSDWQIRVWCPPEIAVITVVGGRKNV